MLYILAPRHSVAVDWCRDMRIDHHSKYVRIVISGEQLQGVRLKPNDGYEVVYGAPHDRFNDDLVEHWYILLRTRES